MTVATAPRTTHRIRLAGPLGKKFGEEHIYYDLRSPAEAIRLLSINIPAFKKYLEVAHNYGVVFQVLQAGVDIGLEDLHLPLGEKEFIIAPVIVGSFFKTIGRAFSGAVRAVRNVVRDVVSSDVGRIVVGAALLAGAIMLGPVGATYAGGLIQAGSGSAAILGGWAAAGVGALGTAMILSGASNMLSPQPEPYDLGSGIGSGDRLGYGSNLQTEGPQSAVRGASGLQSYAYAGPASSLGLGSTVPLIYGKAMTGGGLISAFVEVSDESDPLMEAIREPGPQTFTIGGEKPEHRWKAINGVQTSLSEKFNDLSVDVEIDRGWKYSTDVDQNTSPMRIAFWMRGLYDHVSGPGTTLVDAFITYRVTVYVKQDGNPVPQGSITSTIQGLMTNTQPVYWMQEIDYNSTQTSAGNARVEFEIIDYKKHFTNIQIRRVWSE